ncbi:MAG: hypothetical protein MJA82_11780 [Clostridia bacterium]|nr:hypothetical protein [Clostridia bacterium]
MKKGRDIEDMNHKEFKASKTIRTKNKRNNMKRKEKVDTDYEEMKLEKSEELNPDDFE